MDHSLPLPRNLVEAAKQDGREAWLATLPTTVARLAERWSLTIGPPFQPGGQTARVAPVRDPSGTEMVLKVGWRHPEALHEAEGLRAWAGRGAVWLFAAEELDEVRHDQVLLRLGSEGQRGAGPARLEEPTRR